MKMAMQKYPQAQAPACETLSNWFSSLGAEHIARQVSLITEQFSFMLLVNCITSLNFFSCILFFFFFLCLQLAYLAIMRLRVSQ
jgi:hypothetical protein